VNITNGNVVTGEQFTLLKNALANTTDPSGDGGYNATSGSSVCPAASSTWNVTSDALPAMPANAVKYLTSGAGKGPGLTGTGSQDATGAGVSSSGTATAGSGQASVTATGSGSGSTKNSAVSTIARPFDTTPYMVGLIVLVCSLFGTFLL